MKTMSKPLKKLSRKDLVKITGNQASELDPEGGTNNGGTCGTIIMARTTACCSYEQLILKPECCSCLDL